jgi:hypothetical protein
MGFGFVITPTIQNTSFSFNSAGAEGGGIYNTGLGPILQNSILWGNEAITNGLQIYNSSSKPYIAYCDIQGSSGSGSGWDTTLGTDGGGNIDENPLFIQNPDPGGDGIWGSPDDDYGNLRLDIGSPAIDAGDNTAVPPGVITDLDGFPRFWDDPSTPDTGNGTPPIVDMGAYEFFERVNIYLPLAIR